MASFWFKLYFLKNRATKMLVELTGVRRLLDVLILMKQMPFAVGINY